MRYSYQARQGQEVVKGTTAAENHEAAKKKLEAMGLVVLNMKDERGESFSWAPPASPSPAPTKENPTDQEKPPRTFGQAGIPAIAEVPAIPTPPEPPKEPEAPAFIEVRRKHTVLAGTWEEIRLPVEVLLDTKFGEVKHLVSSTDLRGKICLCMVIEHDVELKKESKK